MPTPLIQRGKGNQNYQEVGPEFPLAVEVYQNPDSKEIVITSHVFTASRRQIPGIGTAADYASGDAFGLSFTIDVPKEGVISSVIFYDLDDEGLNKEIFLANLAFTETADNAAFAVSDADLLNSIGVISIDTWYNYGNNQLGIATPAIWYTAPERKLWCQFITRGADDIAAGSLPEVRLVIT